VNERRFLNQSQPQTLVIATLLLYINAFFAILNLFVLSILLGVVLALGGYGIANEKRWGYGLAVTGAVIQLGLLLLIYGTGVLRFPTVITLLFDGALVALLLHPQSRDYQRIWFS
jgi:hypothetical protein